MVVVGKQRRKFRLVVSLWESGVEEERSSAKERKSFLASELPLDCENLEIG